MMYEHGGQGGNSMSSDSLPGVGGDPAGKSAQGRRRRAGGILRSLVWTLVRPWHPSCLLLRALLPLATTPPFTRLRPSSLPLSLLPSSLLPHQQEPGARVGESCTGLERSCDGGGRGCLSSSRPGSEIRRQGGEGGREGE